MSALTPTGPAPSIESIKEYCRTTHEAMVRNDSPLLLWLSVTFEDMCDLIIKAERCIANDELVAEEDAMLRAKRFRMGGLL